MKRFFARLWWRLTGRAKRRCDLCRCWQRAGRSKYDNIPAGVCRARGPQRLDDGTGLEQKIPPSGQGFTRADGWCFHDFVPR